MLEKSWKQQFACIINDIVSRSNTDQTSTLKHRIVSSITALLIVQQTFEKKMYVISCVVLAHLSVTSSPLALLNS